MADPVELLPDYTTDHERRVISVGDPGCEIVSGDIEALRHLRNPFKARSNGLAWLADEASADFWDPAWPVEKQREAIDMQWLIHRYKGTIPAIQFALSLLGVRAHILEWFNAVPEREPGTFEVIGEVEDAPLFSQELWRLALAAVERTKPLSRHFSLRLVGTKNVPLFLGVYPLTNLTVTTFPLVVAPPTLSAAQRIAVHAFTRLFILTQPKPEAV